MNLKAIHVESIEDGKCIGKRNEREMRDARQRSKITRVAGVTIYISRNGWEIQGYRRGQKLRTESMMRGRAKKSARGERKFSDSFG